MEHPALAVYESNQAISVKSLAEDGLVKRGFMRANRGAYYVHYGIARFITCRGVTISLKKATVALWNGSEFVEASSLGRYHEATEAALDYLGGLPKKEKVH